MYIDEKCTDQNWLPSVYRVLYKTYYERWNLRNQTQHGTDQEYTKQSLLPRISALYSLKESMHPQDQHCFRKPLKEWELSNPTEMKKWLHTHTLHIKQCLKLEQSRLKTHTHDIRNCMKPKQTSRPIQDTDNTPPIIKCAAS